jgi:hypothetical protein
MAAFSPQPEGPGPIFPISASIIVSRHPVCVTPHSWNSKKLAPGATAPVVGTGPSLGQSKKHAAINTRSIALNNFLLKPIRDVPAIHSFTLVFLLYDPRSA